MNQTGNDTLIEILELDRAEMDLIAKIRKRFRHGEITIVIRNGLPVQIRRITEIENLDRSV